MLRSLYDWTMRLAGHRHALWALAAVSFVESSFFPIPPDAMLIPMVLANRNRAWLIAIVCTVASVLGGIAGYAIGYFLFEQIGRPLIELYGYQDAYQTFQAQYTEWGAWIVATAGFTVLPFKVFTIASGVAALNLAVFVIAATLSRGARFFLVAAVLWYFGPPIRVFVERHLGKLTTLFFVLLVGGIVAVRYLF